MKSTNPIDTIKVEFSCECGKKHHAIVCDTYSDSEMCFCKKCERWITVFTSNGTVFEVIVED